MKEGMSVIQKENIQQIRRMWCAQWRRKEGKIVNLDRVVGEDLGEKVAFSKDLKEMKSRPCRYQGKNILGK